MITANLTPQLVALLKSQVSTLTNLIGYQVYLTAHNLSSHSSEVTIANAVKFHKTNPIVGEITVQQAPPKFSLELAFANSTTSLYQTTLMQLVAQKFEHLPFLQISNTVLHLDSSKILSLFGVNQLTKEDLNLLHLYMHFKLHSVGVQFQKTAATEMSSIRLSSILNSFEASV